MNLAEFIEGRRDQHLAELCELLRIPSVSAKSEHKPDIERGAHWVAEIIRDPMCAAFDIRLVFALGADAGNAQEFAKLRQMLVAATFDKFSKVHKGPLGAKSPFEI